MKKFKDTTKIIDRNGLYNRKDYDAIGVNPVFLHFKDYDYIEEIWDYDTQRTEVFYVREIDYDISPEYEYCRIVDDPMMVYNWTSDIDFQLGIIHSAYWSMLYHAKMARA